jgi:hypothetical protein
MEKLITQIKLSWEHLYNLNYTSKDVLVILFLWLTIAFSYTWFKYYFIGRLRSNTEKFYLKQKRKYLSESVKSGFKALGSIEEIEKLIKQVHDLDDELNLPKTDYSLLYKEYEKTIKEVNERGYI